MSLLSWLSKSKASAGTTQLKRPTIPGLPDPNLDRTEEDGRTTEAANREIEILVKQSARQRQRRGPYSKYSPELRCEMARYASFHGVSAASEYFSKRLKKRVNYTTIQSILPQYKAKLHEAKGREAVSSVPYKQRGRPLLLGKKLDDAVCRHLRAIRTAGGVISRSITKATAFGILKACKPSLLSDGGGYYTFLTNSWCNSIHKRINYCKRKGTKAAKKLPEDFNMLKSAFLERIKAKVIEHHIPYDLVLNMDETGLSVVPVSSWTLAEKGSKDIPILGADDKRQITAVVSCSLTGKVLCPQILYQGTTVRCHPPATVSFPEGWDIWHSPSHWSTGDTVKRYVSMILKPWLEKIKEDMHLPQDQRGLLILDVFAAHRTPEVLDAISDNGFELVYVLANCTSELQPLDLSVNDPLKEQCKSSFSMWYAEQVCQAIKDHQGDMDKAVQSVKPDLRLSVLKPLQASWMIDAFAHVAANPRLVRYGWEAAGITQMMLEIPAPLGDDQGQTNVELASCEASKVINMPLQQLYKSFSPVTEHFLPHDLCQSRIDGRSGSHACTVISALAIEAVLKKKSNAGSGSMLLFPESELVEQYVDCIRKGNALYDSVFFEQGNPFLSTYDVVTRRLLVDCKIPQYGEIWFQDKDQGLNLISDFLKKTRQLNSSGGVFTSKGNSVALIFGMDFSVLLDSHCHGRRGALLAAADSPEEIFGYICHRLGICPVRGAAFCFLQLSSSP